MVKLLYRLHQESPKVVELEVGLHHGCLGGDHGCPEVVKLVMGFTMDVLVVTMDVPKW